MTHPTLSPEALEKANRLSRNIEAWFWAPILVLSAAIPLLAAVIAWKPDTLSLLFTKTTHVLLGLLLALPAVWIVATYLAKYLLELQAGRRKGWWWYGGMTPDPLRSFSSRARAGLYGAAAGGCGAFFSVSLVTGAAFWMGYRSVHQTEPLLMLAAEPVGLICGIREGLRWAKQSASSKCEPTARGE